MRFLLTIFFFLTTAFSFSNAHADPMLSPVCESAVMDTMTKISTINLGPGEPYYMGISEIIATGKTSPYSDVYGMPIVKVTVRYEDVCIGDFEVHNGESSCFISSFTYECR